LPSSDFKQLRAHILSIEFFEQIRLLLSLPEMPPVVEARKSRMEPSWWGAEDDRQLLLCLLRFGRDDCSANISEFPHFKGKLDAKFQKQFVLYRIEKILPKWWECRTRCVARRLLSHGYPVQLLSRAFKASGYSWTRKFAQSDVLLTSLPNFADLAGEVSAAELTVAGVDEASFWKNFHSTLPAGFALSIADVTDFGKFLLFRIMGSLGMKNAATQEAVKLALKPSKANEDMTDLKFPGFWPVEFSRDQAFAMLWRIQTLFFLSSGTVTEKDVHEQPEILAPFQTDTALGLFNRALTEGLDSADVGSLQATIYLACKLLSTKVSVTLVSGDSVKRGRDEEEQPSAKKAKVESEGSESKRKSSGGKQQNLKELFSQKNGW